MKILIKPFSTELNLLGNAFSVLGHSVGVWNSSSSAFDTFDKFEPDVFITEGKGINKDIVKCLNMRPYVKNIIKVSNNSKLVDDLNKFYTVNCATQQELNLVNSIEYNKVLYTSNQTLEATENWGNIEQIGNSADITYSLYNKDTSSIYSDILYIGNYNHYSSLVLNKTLLPLCYSLDYNIKVFGFQKAPVPQYCGVCPYDKLNVMKRGAKINLHLGKMHEIQYGFEVSSDIYNNYLNGYFTLSSPYITVPTETFYSIEELRQKIEYFSNKEDEKQRVINNHKHIALKNTNIHRASRMLELIGENNCQAQVQQLIEKFLSLEQKVL